MGSLLLRQQQQQQQKERKEKCVVRSAVPNETDEAEASSGLSVSGNPPVPALQLQWSSGR